MNSWSSNHFSPLHFLSQPNVLIYPSSLAITAVLSLHRCLQTCALSTEYQTNYATSHARAVLLVVNSNIPNLYSLSYLLLKSNMQFYEYKNQDTHFQLAPLPAGRRRSGRFSELFGRIQQQGNRHEQIWTGVFGKVMPGEAFLGRMSWPYQC